MTTALALAATHSPPRIRLIGLFSVAFGLAVGWLLARLVDQLESPASRRAIGVASAVFTLCGLIGSTWETSRLNEIQETKRVNEVLEARLLEQTLKMAGDREGNISLPSLPKASMSLTVFRGHLARRIRPLGEWSSPWPEAFWCLELIVAAAASAWISTRRTWTKKTDSANPTAAN
jgi:hypothetical protein